MKKYLSNRKVQFVATTVLIAVTVLSFQNCSKLNTSGVMNGAATGSQIVSSSMGGLFASTGTSNAPRCVFNGNPSGSDSIQHGATSEVIGTIQLSYSASDGTGSGKCRYDLGTVGSTNPGSAFNVTGTCTDPSGNTFSSQGSFWQVNGSQKPPTSFNMIAGIGNCGSGDDIYLSGVVNVVSLQVSNVKIAERVVTSNTASEKILATASGTYSGKNPFAAYDGWSTVISAMTLPEGSVCKVFANPWGSEELIVANCTARDGRSFNMSGFGYERGALASGVDFEFEGTAQDGSTYDHFYKYRNGTWQGMWLNKGAVGYDLNYFDRSGAYMGKCSLGTANASGDISGTCVLNNTSFPISGNVGALGSDGLYHVSLSGVVNGVNFNATVSFDDKAGSSVALGSKWTSSDGNYGTISASAIK